MKTPGKLIGIGVGPGAPDLLTLRAHRIIEATRIIAYPAPDTGQSFARSIVKQWMVDKKEIPIVIPMRTERFPAAEIYDRAAAEISRHLDDGQDVAVLCEGDPFFYGSFMYLFERLSERYETQIVPGISSIMASAAVLQRPLAARNDVLTILPGPLDDATLEKQIESSQAVAIIKVGRHLQRLAALIARLGLTDQAGYLERVSLQEQRVMPLAEVTEDSAPYFSIILIYKGAERWAHCTHTAAVGGAD